MHDIIHEIPMDCGKFHMMHGVMLLLSTGKSECQYCYLCMHYTAIEMIKADSLNFCRCVYLPIHQRFTVKTYMHTALYT